MKAKRMIEFGVQVPNIWERFRETEIWLMNRKTGDGIPVKDMSNEHLVNALSWTRGICPSKYDPFVLEQILINEFNYRMKFDLFKEYEPKIEFKNPVNTKVCKIIEIDTSYRVTFEVLDSGLTFEHFKYAHLFKRFCEKVSQAAKGRGWGFTQLSGLTATLTFDIDQKIVTDIKLTHQKLECGIDESTDKIFKLSVSNKLPDLLNPDKTAYLDYSDVYGFSFDYRKYGSAYDLVGSDYDGGPGYETTIFSFSHTKHVFQFIRNDQTFKIRLNTTNETCEINTNDKYIVGATHVYATFRHAVSVVLMNEANLTIKQINQDFSDKMVD